MACKDDFAQCLLSSMDRERAVTISPPLSLGKSFPRRSARDAAMAAAHATGEYSYQQIAEFFGVHLATVSDGGVLRRLVLSPRAVTCSWMMTLFSARP